MSCEQYRKAISEAVVTPEDAVLQSSHGNGRLPQRAPWADRDIPHATRPQATLKAHLGECASCSELYTNEKNLFAAIDRELTSVVNTDATPSFLPRVRAAIEAERAVEDRSRAWFVLWPATALVVAFALFFTIFPRFHPQQQIAPQVTAATSTTISSANSSTISTTHSETNSIAGDTNAPPQKTLRRDVREAAAPQLLMVSARNPTATSPSLEVLVPPDEREALARFVAQLPRRREIAIALTKPVPVTPSVDAASAPLEIAELKIEPLSPAEAE